MSFNTRFFTALFALFTLSAAMPAVGAGAFFDDFDFYADQTAYEASDWDPVPSYTVGTLSTTYALGFKSLQVQQSPSEARPTTQLGKNDGGSVPATGRLDLWFYDDGADIKAFDISVLNGATKASVGLRDAQVGTNTNYVLDANGSLVDSGIERSTGWHLVQFAVDGTNGTTVQIDKEDFASNTVPALTAAMDLTIFTNLGDPSDENLLWIDSVNWREGDAYAVLPAEAIVESIEHFETGIGNWTPLPGTNVVDLHHNVDNAGSDGSAAYIDVYDHTGPRGFEGSLPNKVRFDGKYRLGFDFGNFADGDWEAWANLTVTMNGTSSVNLGSTELRDWNPAETSTAVDLDPSSTVLIQVTADSAVEPGFVRFDNFYLILEEFNEPVTAVSDWQLY